MKAHLLPLLVYLSLAATATAKMNVVLILIDDLSHYGVSAYGAEKLGSVHGFFEDQPFETPQMDRLAEGGAALRLCVCLSTL